MSQTEYDFITKQVFLLHNKARENPQCFIYDLEQRLLNLCNKYITLPSGKQVKTREGNKGIEECIRFLRRQQPLYPLLWEDKLSLAAFDHANDIGSRGIITHQGSDGSTLKTRIEKYGKWKNLLGENMSFGIQDPKEIILQLLIDDGVQGRGHRNNLFTAAFSVVGISFTNHAKYHICGVMDYAGQFFQNQTDILNDANTKTPPLFPQSPHNQKIPIWINAQKYIQDDKNIQSEQKLVANPKIQQIMSIDLDNLGVNRRSDLKEQQQQMSQSGSFHQENQQQIMWPGTQRYENETRRIEQEGRLLTQDMVKSLVSDEVKQIKQTVISNQSLAKKQTPSSPQEQQSFRQQTPQKQLNGAEQLSTSQSKNISQLFGNFLEERIYKPKVQNINTNDEIIIKFDTKVQSNESSLFLAEKYNHEFQSRQSEMTSCFQKDNSLGNNLDSLIDKLFTQALMNQKKGKKNLTLNLLTNQSIQFDSQVKLTEMQDSNKKILKSSQKLESPRKYNKAFSDLHLRNQNQKKAGHKIQFEKLLTNIALNPNDEGFKLVSSNLDLSEQIILSQNKYEQSKKDSKQGGISREQKLSKPNQRKKDEVIQVNKSPKIQKEIKQYPIMSISNYLFGYGLMLGPHRIKDLRSVSEEEIIYFYKNLENNQVFQKIEELLTSYKYENYSLYLLKIDPGFFNLCLDNYNLFLKGSNQDSLKTKWKESYMPIENHIPYLRSIGYLLDQKGSEFIFKLIQSYYNKTQFSQNEQKITISKKQRDSLKQSQITKTSKYSFDGVLLSVLACKCLHPNPTTLRESLSCFDEKQTGILDKVTTMDILCSIGEGVTVEEIKIFYDEFQDWNLQEIQRQQRIQCKKKETKQKKQKSLAKDTNLKEFMVSDAQKILTILPY